MKELFLLFGAWLNVGDNDFGYLAVGIIASTGSVETKIELLVGPAGLAYRIGAAVQLLIVLIDISRSSILVSTEPVLAIMPTAR